MVLPLSLQGGETRIKPECLLYNNKLVFCNTLFHCLQNVCHKTFRFFHTDVIKCWLFETLLSRYKWQTGFIRKKKYCKKIRISDILMIQALLTQFYVGNEHWLLNLTRLGVNRVKPWNSVRINLGLGLRGPDIGPGLYTRHLIIEGHRGLRRW